MKATVFDYVIFYNPTDEFETPEVIAEGRVIAKDHATAVLLAAREIPESRIEQINDIEVLVRPFK